MQGVCHITIFKLFHFGRASIRSFNAGNIQVIAIRHIDNRLNFSHQGIIVLLRAIRHDTPHIVTIRNIHDSVIPDSTDQAAGIVIFAFN